MRYRSGSCLEPDEHASRYARAGPAVTRSGGPETCAPSPLGLTSAQARMEVGRPAVVSSSFRPALAAPAGEGRHGGEPSGQSCSSCAGAACWRSHILAVRSPSRHYCGTQPVQQQLVHHPGRLAARTAPCGHPASARNRAAAAALVRQGRSRPERSATRCRSSARCPLRSPWRLEVSRQHDAGMGLARVGFGEAARVKLRTHARSACRAVSRPHPMAWRQ